MSLLVSVIAVLVLSLSPTHVQVLGTEGSCGMPVTTALQPSTIPDSRDDIFGFTKSIYEQCHSQSVVRVVIAIGVFAIGGVGGLLMAGLAPSAAERQRRQYEQWQHAQWALWQAQQGQHGGPPQYGPPA